MTKKNFGQLFLLIVLSLAGLYVFSNSYDFAESNYLLVESAVMVYEGCLALKYF